MRYLLDTNVFIAVMNTRSTVVDPQYLHNRALIALSSLVLHELYYGAFRSIRIDANLSKIEALELTILPFDSEDARVAGRVRAMLGQTGTPIGPIDTLIAGQALARDLTLVTNNTREFSRVEALRLEAWTLPR